MFYYTIVHVCERVDSGIAWHMDHASIHVCLLPVHRLPTSNHNICIFITCIESVRVILALYLSLLSPNDVSRSDYIFYL